MGGQTALNLAIKAEKSGLLKKYKIELIGANSKAIENAEDRKKFRKNMSDIGIDLPKSEILNNFSPNKKGMWQSATPQLSSTLLSVNLLPAAPDDMGAKSDDITYAGKSWACVSA